MKLTKAQRAFLEDAERYTNSRHGTDGVGAAGARGRMASQLEGRGLVVCLGWGVSVDDHEKERLVFAITDRGRAALAPSPAAEETP